MEDIYIARRPFYNRQHQVAGYELLLHENHVKSEPIDDAHAASRLICNTFLEMGLENVVGSLPALISLPNDFFLGEPLIPIPPEQVIFIIQGAKPPDSEMMNALQHYSDRGYIFALENVRYSPKLEPLLKLASYAIIEAGMLGQRQMGELVAQCRRHSLEVIARDVDTAEILAELQQLDVDYYEGSFFSQPEVIQSRRTPNNRTLLLKLLDALQGDADMQQIEMMLIQDAALCYKLLRYLDCANYEGRAELDSFSEALTLLGNTTLRKWVSLLLMINQSRDLMDEPLRSAQLRACLCEQLVKNSHAISPEQARTLGLFSCLDDVMAAPLEELLDSVPLHSTLKLALLDHEGELGKILAQVLELEQQHALPPDALEKGESDPVSPSQESHGRMEKRNS